MPSMQIWRKNLVLKPEMCPEIAAPTVAEHVHWKELLPCSGWKETQTGGGDGDVSVV